jgi:Cof subfamily protein (haloacid dehalogenase superfamily)
LLTTDKRISEENAEALRKVKNAGYKVVLCSGRSPKSMERYVKQLGLEEEGDFYLGNHGGVIVDAFRDIKIEEKTIDQDKVRWFVEKGRKYCDLINVHLYKNDYFYIERREQSTAMYEKLTSMKAGVLVPDLMEYVDKGIAKALFISDCPGRVLEMKSQLENEGMPSGMRLVASSAYLLEYADDEINKGIAVNRLMEYLGIAMNEVICVGDSYNDISMINVAGLGIAVRNAEEEVKKAAGYITERTNDEHAIVEIVDKFLLNKENR